MEQLGKYFINSRLSSTAKTTGDISDINYTGITFIGNSVTGKPEAVGTGSGTGGMIVSSYATQDNFAYLYIRNNVSTTNFVWAYRKYGGIDGGWTLIA